jgi:hypothetical protein
MYGTSMGSILTNNADGKEQRKNNKYDSHDHIAHNCVHRVGHVDLEMSELLQM